VGVDAVPGGQPLQLAARRVRRDRLVAEARGDLIGLEVVRVFGVDGVAGDATAEKGALSRSRHEPSAGQLL